MKSNFIDLYIPASLSVVEVNFSEESYAVNESEGQVSLSLRITGRFYIPVYAIIEVSDGTATGGTWGIHVCTQKVIFGIPIHFNRQI